MTKIFDHFNDWLGKNFVAREEGQGVVEYALVLGVLVVALFVAFVTTDIATGIGTAVGKIVAKLNT